MSNNGKSQVRVATYARVSTQDQAPEGTSLDFQAAQLDFYCKTQGWNIANSYVDPGYSGKDDQRPELKRLMADAKLGRFEKVVVCKLDRMARNLRIMLNIEDNLRKCDVTLTSIKESVDTSTSTGKLVFSMFSMIAEWERETIAERTNSGRLQRYREGSWAGSKPPFGYQRNPQTRKLDINEAEAVIVRRIYNTYVSGKSLIQMTDILNQDKVPTRRKGGRGWTPSSVRHLLINPVYKGTAIVNRHANISDLKKVDMSKAIIIPVPPIVTEQDWKLAQDRLDNNPHSKPTKDGVFLLQGMIRCGNCHYSYRTERIYGKRYYECRGRLKASHPDGSAKCPSRSLPAEWLENQVWTRIEDVLNDPNKLEPVLLETINNLRSREAELNARRKPVDDRLADIDGQKRKLADDWVVRNLEPAKFDELRRNLNKEEERLKGLIAEFDPAEIEDLETTRGVLRFWENQIRSMAWNLEDDQEGHMVRTIDKPHDTVLRVVGFEDKDMTKLFGLPATKREMLDKFQVKLVVYADRIDVKATFDIAPISCQNVTLSELERGGVYPHFAYTHANGLFNELIRRHTGSSYYLRVFSSANQCHPPIFFLLNWCYP